MLAQLSTWHQRVVKLFVLDRLIERLRTDLRLLRIQVTRYPNLMIGCSFTKISSIIDLNF